MPAAGPVAHARCQGAVPRRTLETARERTWSRCTDSAGHPQGVQAGLDFGAPMAAGAFAGAAVPKMKLPSLQGIELPSVSKG
jgi:hypothetical protein